MRNLYSLMLASFASIASFGTNEDVKRSMRARDRLPADTQEMLKQKAVEKRERKNAKRLWDYNESKANNPITHWF